MIIGINGKIGSGKDTIGKIIQGLCLTNKGQVFEIKKFAGKLKQIGSILSGVSAEKFEDQEFKKQEMPECWNKLQQSGRSKVSMPMTYREFLQKIGTEAMREGLHTNVWVNALFADYTAKWIPTGNAIEEDEVSLEKQYPNWIITDMRFPNEMDAVELRWGITIRVVKYKVGDKVYWTDPEGVCSGQYEVTEIHQDFCFINNEFSEAQVPYNEIKIIAANLHPSETALDDAKFDYEIINDGTLEDLVHKVRDILVKEELI